MKNKISIFILSLIAAVLFTACGDDDSTFDGPFRLNIAGPSEVRPESTEEYTIGDFTNPGSYTWTVSGPATINGSASGNTISVTFGEVGDVVITVTNGTDNGTYTVEVADTEPAVEVELQGTGVLRNGMTDTVFFNFNAPIVDAPTFAMNTTDSTQFNGGNPFVSGTLGALEMYKSKADVYYALYTAGTGNGTPEALFQDIKSTTTYGEVNIDSAFVQLYRVDNTAPIADISYSDDMVNDSTVVTVTVTFTEEVMFDFTQATVDSAIYVSFDGAGVLTETDTLQPTDDPKVFTYEYTVNGEGNGTVDVTLSNVVDLAGNPVALVNNDEFAVDNIAPTILITSAVDTGDYVELSITSSEGGVASYMILGDGEDAPTSADDFGGGLFSGDISATGSTELAVPSGEYDVYFIVTDNAGNVSAIDMVDLSVVD